MKPFYQKLNPPAQSVIIFDEENLIYSSMALSSEIEILYVVKVQAPVTLAIVSIVLMPVILQLSERMFLTGGKAISNTLTVQ